MKSLTTALFMLLTGLSGLAQTGSFNTSISFAQQNRTLSCYVPADYDSSKAVSLMICLHGAGDNSTNYRNALINSLKWNNVFPNTIFICPDGGSDASKDFYTPEGDEDIIRACVDFAKSKFYIDGANTYLQGFSLGGRSALRYGLQNPAAFKGLLLNTPAVQGLQDAKNTPAVGNVYSWENASQVKVYITVGSEDVLYAITVMPAVMNLKKNDGIVRFINVAGLAHTIPAAQYTQGAIAFFDNPASHSRDLDIFSHDIPVRICSTGVSPVIYVQNTGADIVSKINFEYELGSSKQNYTWNGSLASFKSSTIQLPFITGSNGIQNFRVKVLGINDADDQNAANDTLSTKFDLAVTAGSTIYREDFETNNNTWVNPPKGSVFGWFQDSDNKRSGNYSMGALNTLLLFYSQGDTETLVSPVMDLSKINPLLTFDVAFNYHKYTPPYVASDLVLADTLEVEISNDCGNTWKSIYKKGGADLATKSAPLLNPLDLGSVFITFNESEWRRETVNLDAYKNYTSGMVRFNYISGMGGYINIDNVSFDAAFSGVESIETASFDMYPNPAKDRVKVVCDKPAESISIFDLSGRRLRTFDANGQTSFFLFTDDLNTGAYLIEISGRDFSLRRKLMID